MDDLVSIVVTIFNAYNYLPRCIDSILGQTYNNLQIILVNDGSTDNSLVICEDYARRDKRIEIVNKSNSGVADTRNVGVSKAKGLYLAFVDSDDYIHEKYIENMYNSLKRGGADICVCDSQIVNEGEEDLSVITQKPTLSTSHLDGTFPSETVVKALPSLPFLVVLWNKLYRRDLFDEIIFPKVHICEDEFVFHRLFAICDKVSMLPERLYFYIKRSESLTTRPFSAYRFDALIALDDRMNFYLEKKSYELLRMTCSAYIKCYIKLYIQYKMLPVYDKECALLWKDYTAKFRSHGLTMFKYGRLVIYLRFLLAGFISKVYSMLLSVFHKI